MIIIKIDSKNPIERALKTLKSKVIKTKQNEILKGKKEYTKKSVRLRTQKIKSIYKERFINSR